MKLAKKSLVLLVIIFIPIAYSYAQCDIPDVRSQWDKSLIIFEGTVSSITYHNNLLDLHLRKYHVVSFSNINIYKGNLIVNNPDTLSFIVQNGLGDYLNFQQGKRYLIYAEKDPLSHFLYIPQCSRTRPLDECEFDIHYLLNQKDTISELFYFQYLRRIKQNN